MASPERRLHGPTTWTLDLSTSQGLLNRPEGQGEVLGQIRAPEFEPGDNPFQALIGRDILSRGVLNLSFDGHYSFSY